MFEIEKGGANPDQARKTDRKIYFEEFKGYRSCPTFERSLLKANNIIKGPAIVEQMDSTIVVLPDYRAAPDRYGNLVIRECEKGKA